MSRVLGVFCTGRALSLRWRDLHIFPRLYNMSSITTTNSMMRMINAMMSPMSSQLVPESVKER